MSHDAMDLKEVLERVQDDHELLAELLQIYAEDYTEKIKNLKEAVAKNDIEQVCYIAHSLKGASGNIAAKKLHILFLNLEHSAKEGKLTDAPSLIESIEKEFVELQDYVKNMPKASS